MYITEKKNDSEWDNSGRETQKYRVLLRIYIKAYLVNLGIE